MWIVLTVVTIIIIIITVNVDVADVILLLETVML